MIGALCVCLATIFWCVAIVRRQRKGPDWFLALLLGAVCILQGVRLLQHVGFISLLGPLGLDSFDELLITGLYLTAILALRKSAIERKSTAVRLRLVEANDQQRPFVDLEGRDQSVADLILSSNPLPTIGLDKSGTVIYWNSAAEQLLGWKADDVLAKPSPVSLNSPIQMKSGACVRVDSWVSPIHDSSGRPCGTIYVLAPLGTSEAAPALICDAPILNC